MRPATSFKIGLCRDPKCRAVHLWAIDDDEEEPFASITIAVEDVGRITEALRDLAYVVAVLKEDAA